MMVFCRFLLVAAALLAATQSATAEFKMTFTNITNNTGENGANYSVTLYGKDDAGYGTLGTNEVVFVFRVGSGETGKISEIYFQDGTLLALSETNVNNVGTVDFEAPGADVSPTNLPGGNTLAIPFTPTANFFATESVSGTANAVAADEATGVKFTLKANLDYDDVVAALQQGASLADATGAMNGGLRIGIHVRDARGQRSDSFINEQPPSEPPSIVPVPPGMALALSGVAGLGLLGALRSIRRWRAAVR